MTKHAANPAQGRAAHGQQRDKTERVRAAQQRSDESLSAAQVALPGLLETAPDAIVLIDEAHRIVLVNAQAVAMFGYDPDELIGQSIELLLSPRFSELYAAEQLDRANQSRPPPIRLQHDLAGRRQDGSQFPVELRVSPLPAPAGGLAMAIIRDITQQKQADAELQKRASQEAAIAEFGRHAVARTELPLLMDQATRLVANTLDIALSGVLELSADGSILLFKSLSLGPHSTAAQRQRIDPAVVDHIGSFAGHAIRVGQPVIFSNATAEARFDLSLLNSWGIASAAAVPLKLHNRPYGVLAAYSATPREFSTEDVHFLEAIAYLLAVGVERQFAEEAVRRDRDFAESLIETAQAIVLVLDTAGRILRFNPYTEELTGYRLEDLKGMDWCAALLPKRKQDEGCEMFEAAATGRRLCNAIHSIVTKDGVEHEIEWSGRALTEASGAVVGVLFIGHDISELRQAQKRVLESERLAAIGHMASGLAHESRNALQQIGACAEMLAMELENYPEALDLVVGVQEAEARLHRLFEDVRAYAVPLRLEPRNMNLAEVWRKAWSSLKVSHANRQLNLTEHCANVNVECIVDASMIEQTFLNILENSIDACTDPVKVEIHCRDEMLAGRPALAISIRDNGPGLSGEQRDRVLEPFFTTKTQGTGLGMSIVKRIIDAHGGRLDIAGEQGGAQFLITLPREV